MTVQGNVMTDQRVTKLLFTSRETNEKKRWLGLSKNINLPHFTKTILAQPFYFKIATSY